MSNFFMSITEDELLPADDSAKKQTFKKDGEDEKPNSPEKPGTPQSRCTGNSNKDGVTVPEPPASSSTKVEAQSSSSSSTIPEPTTTSSATTEAPTMENCQHDTERDVMAISRLVDAGCVVLKTLEHNACSLLGPIEKSYDSSKGFNVVQGPCSNIAFDLTFLRMSLASSSVFFFVFAFLSGAFLSFWTASGLPTFQRAFTGRRGSLTEISQGLLRVPSLLALFLAVHLCASASAGALTSSELQGLISSCTSGNSRDCSAVETADTSQITDMTNMFYSSPFNRDISKWNVSAVNDMKYMFGNASFNGNISQWDVSAVTTMQGMFYQSSFNGDISNWDVSAVNVLIGMFSTSSFNGDISKWDVSAVSDMFAMFFMSSFNEDISKWDVSHVDTMGYLFLGSPFNRNISKWDVSDVTKMSSMFRLSQFNGDISEWDVSAVDDMRSMFHQSSFNGNISEWEVSAVNTMQHMFCFSRFNGDISKWDVSSVKEMSNMFTGSSFDGNISTWDVSVVNAMSWMFGSTSFNRDISKWDVSAVTTMFEIFGSSSFNGDISEWDVSAVSDMSAMFRSSPFNRDISKWNVAAVEDMHEMFHQSSFNGDISEWSVTATYNMSWMFSSSPFNRDISKWDVSAVTDFQYMFSDDGILRQSPFNTDISTWAVNPNTNIFLMFRGALMEATAGASGFGKSHCPTIPDQLCAEYFCSKQLKCKVDKCAAEAFASNDCQNLGSWNVSQVGGMESLFAGVKSFNLAISSWETSRANTFKSMFEGAELFNGDISRWNTSKVRKFERMFLGASSFNSEIYTWDVRRGQNFAKMFFDASSFNRWLCGWEQEPRADVNLMYSGSCPKVIVCECPDGYFNCTLGTGFQTECPAGYFCTGGTADKLPCASTVPAGSYCEERTRFANEHVLCPIGHLCSGGSNNKVVCASGTYQDERGHASCKACDAGGYCVATDTCGGGYVPCEPGTFNPNKGNSSVEACQPCPLGTSSPQTNAKKSESCKPCTPGTFGDSKGMHQCTRCQAGKYQNSTGATHCRPCEAGTYCLEGSSAPLPCPAGFRTNPNLTVMTSSEDCFLCEAGTFCSIGSSTATRCAAGSFGAQAGLDTCELCAAGSFSAIGATACSNCEVGKYADNAGQGFCIPCPFPLISSKGSTSCSLCKEEYYLRFIGADPTDIFKDPDQFCRTCPPKVDCIAGVTLAELPIPPRMWRASRTSSRIYDCFADKSGYSPCIGSGSRRAGDAEDDGKYCVDGHRGPLCQVCVDETEHYVPTTGRCEKCSQNSSIGTLVGCAVGIAALLALSFAAVRKVGILGRLVRRISAFSFNLGLRAKFKVLVSFYQIFNTLESNYGVRFDRQFTSWLNVLGLMDFDYIGLLLPSKCVGSINDRLVTNAVWPFGAILIVFLAVSMHAVAVLPKSDTSRTVSAVFYRSLDASIQVVCLVLPTVTRSIFSARQCVSFGTDDFSGTSISFLNADLTLRCNEDDPDYSGLNAYFWTFFVIWFVLVPLSGMALLLMIKDSVRAMHITNLADACRFLWWDYKPSFLYWELIDLFRKLLLTALILFVDTEFGDSKLMRLWIAITVSGLYLTIVALARPFKRFDDMALACISNLVLICCFVSGFSIKLCQEGPWNDSCEAFFGLKGSYQANLIEIILTIVMMVVSLIVIIIVAINNPTISSIRLANSGLEPFLELATGCNFHCFLSHAWSTGQDQAHTIARQLKLMLPDIKVWLDVDNFEFGGTMEEAVGESSVFLVFISRGYLRSANCRRQINAALAAGKPVVCVREDDKAKGGSTVDELKQECRNSFKEQAAEEVIKYLFTNEPIVWQRVRAFQVVSLKIIALQMLQHSQYYTNNPSELTMGLKVAGELGPVGFQKPFRLLVCRDNIGAWSVAEEVSTAALEDQDGSYLSRTLSQLSQNSLLQYISIEDAYSVLHEATNPPEKRTVLLLYLNTHTFLDSENTVGELVQKAMDMNICIVKVHERDHLKSGCAFSDFYDQTPQNLIECKLFDTLAIPLYPMAEHRKVSLRYILCGMGAKPTRERRSAAPRLRPHESAQTTRADQNHEGNVALQRGMDIPAVTEVTAEIGGVTNIGLDPAVLSTGQVESNVEGPAQVLEWLESMMQSELMSAAQIKSVISRALEIGLPQDGSVALPRLGSGLLQQMKDAAFKREIGCVPHRPTLQEAEPATLSYMPKDVQLGFAAGVSEEPLSFITTSDNDIGYQPARTRSSPPPDLQVEFNSVGQIAALDVQSRN